MSSSTELLVAMDAVVIAVSGPVGLAANAVGAVAYGAYAAVRKLHDDYQQELADFQARSLARQQEIAAGADRQAADADTAQRLITATRVQAEVDAGAQFLHDRLCALRERQPELDVRIDALDAEIAQHPDALGEHLAQYYRLLDTARTDAKPDAIAQEIDRLHEELASPLLDTAGRAQLQRQLDTLREVAVRQPSVARQGLTLLGQRIQREQQDQLTARLARAREAEALRELVAGALARLQALARHELLPEYATQGKALLTRLSMLLAQEPLPLDDIRRLAADAEALFTACDTAVQERAVSAILGDQVTEVLLSLGYDVTQVPGVETQVDTLLASVDHDYGVELSLRGDGRVSTQMVALSQDGVHADADDQEKVCQLVDKLVAALRQRKVDIRERFRASLQPGEELRVIEGETVETTVTDTTPKAMKVDQP